MCSEELELLATLYPPDTCEINIPAQECYLYYKIEGNDYYKTVVTVKLPESYPNSLPVITIDSNLLTSSQKQFLTSKVIDTATNSIGEQYILIIISEIQSYMDEVMSSFGESLNKVSNNNNINVNADDNESEESDVELIELPSKQKVVGKPKPTSGKENAYVGFNQQTGILDVKELEQHTYQILTKEELQSMCIIRSISTECKKSKFFTHTAYVKDDDQAMRFVRWVQCRFSDATHNMYCYRVKNDIEINEVADDDGEKAASGKMMFVMRQMGVYNRAVVVTRYWGGILLGSVRFKLINESMVSAIVMANKLDPNFDFEQDKDSAKRWRNKK